MDGQVYTSRNGGLASLTFPHEALAEHLYAYKPGWTATTEYGPCDERLPETLRKFCPEGGVHGMVVTPLVIGGRTLGWFKLATGSDASCDVARWWRTVLTEAIARQAALAIHPSQLIEQQPRRGAAQGDSRGAQPAGARHPRQPGAGVRRDPDAAAGRPARHRQPRSAPSRRRSTPRSTWRARIWSRRGGRSAPCARTSATASRSPPRSSASATARS